MVVRVCPSGARGLVRAVADAGGEHDPKPLHVLSRVWRCSAGHDVARYVLRRSTVRYVGVDWSHRGDYMAGRHGVTVEQAGEALADPDRLVFDPDYASQSGRSARTIGWSTSAGRLLTIITVADGEVYGVNGWPANDIDTRHYQGREGC